MSLETCPSVLAAYISEIYEEPEIPMASILIFLIFLISFLLKSFGLVIGVRVKVIFSGAVCIVVNCTYLIIITGDDSGNKRRQE